MNPFFALRVCGAAVACLCALHITGAAAPEPTPVQKAFIDGTGPGWSALTEERLRQRQLRAEHLDLDERNCPLHRQTRRRDPHRKAPDKLRAGRPVAASASRAVIPESFVWATPESIAEPAQGKGRLPTGIEVQVLDHGYAEQYEKESEKKADWFTTNGDVFPAGTSKMKPFPPVSPERPAQLPAQEPQQRRRRVEPLLRPRHQRRSAAVGQRRRSLRRHGHPSRPAAIFAWNRKERRWNLRSSEFANCPSAMTN